MRRLIAVLLTVGLVLPGCATSLRPRAQTTAPGVRALPDHSALSDLAHKLPVGARVRAKVAGDGTIRGTLIRTTDTAIVIQPRARVAEPLLEIPFNRLEALEQETSSGGPGKAIAIGAAAGAGAALGTILLLFAIFGD
jgi:hypothetical protein